MRCSIVLAIAVLPCVTACFVPRVCHAGEEVLMSYLYFSDTPSHRIVSVDNATREVIVALADRPEPFIPDPFMMMTSEGPAILAVASLAGQSPDLAVRLEITEVLDDGSVRATFGPDAAGVVAEGPAFLGRPFSGNMAEIWPTGVEPKPVATKAIRALPDVVRSAKPAPPAAGMIDPIAAARAVVRRTHSMNNLRQISLACLNYDSAVGHLPPAAVIGPDGKPWHSWRVLILPYLGELDLYKQYDFSEPWDSPKNAALVAKVPNVFRDPAADGEDGSTHYAVLVGEATLFPPGGNPKMAVAGAGAGRAPGARGTKLIEVADGTSNTIMVATVNPARKIPWTKPEDIVVDDDGPSIGTREGIGAIHPAGAGVAGIVATSDGAVRVLSAALDRGTLAALATRNGGEVIDHASLDVPGMEAGPDEGPRALKIVVGPGGELFFEAD